MATINLIIKTVSLILLISIISIVSVYSFYPTAKHNKNEPKKYALLIGGGVTEMDTYDSYFKNIEYALNVLLKLGYYKEDIKILFYGGQKTNRTIVERNATKKILINELSHLENTIDSNDSLVIFRSGHGIIDLVFKKYETLPDIEHVPEFDKSKCVGTIAVMRFPDGVLNCLEFQQRLARIKAKQIVVILNQCFSGQFADIPLRLDNTLVVSQSDLAFHQTRETLRWKHDEWPFVKCLFDGFLHNGTKGEKQSVYNAFQYMLECNPNIEGIPIQVDQPLLRENPQIKYGRSLKKGTVYIY